MGKGRCSERPDFNKRCVTSTKALGEMGNEGHAPSQAHLVAVIRFGFLNIRRINRRPDVTSNGPQTDRS
jgi:hypothetical protein